jgi:hypothetical protein
MELPPFRRDSYGIVYGIYPSTARGAGVEVWHSSANTTATSTWAKALLPASTAAMTHTVQLPLSTRYRYAKAKTVGPGAADSAFTATVRAKPQKLPAFLPAVPPLQGNEGMIEFPVPIWMNATQTIEVGAPSEVSPTTYLTKTMTVHPSQFVAQNNTYAYSITGTDLRPGSTSLTGFTANLAVAPGILLTSISARFYKASSADVYNISVAQRTSTGDSAATALLLVSSTATTVTGWHTRGLAFSHTCTSAGYLATLALNANSSGVNGARFGWMRLTYRMPSYDKSI